MNISAELKPKFDLLKQAIFDQNALQDKSLAKLADQLGINHRTAVTWFSYMLKFHSDNGTPPPDQLCPSCGKEKNEVKTQAECRDVFHYL